jgi:hypothetical protein
MVMVAYNRRHRPGAIARLPLLLCSLFYLLSTGGVPVGRPGAPNFALEQALRGRKCTVSYSHSLKMFSVVTIR